MRIVSKPDYSANLIEGGKATKQLQDYLDDIELRLNTNLLGNAVILPSYTVSSVPDATLSAGGMIYVANESGGAVPAFSDGTNWRRVTDRAIVS